MSPKEWLTLKYGWSDKGWFWGPLELEVPKPFVSNGTTLTFNLCTLCCRLRSLPLRDFKFKVSPVPSCALLCCWRCLSQRRACTHSALKSVGVVQLWMFSIHSPLTLRVWNPCRESAVSGYLNSRVSDFFPSYLTLRHVHITWSPLTEEVIWSHGVLYSIYSSSIRGQLRHQILHRLLRKSDLGLQPVPTPFHGWENRWNQPAFCFFGLKWYTPCKEMRVDISETEHLTPEAINKFNKCGNKSQLELIK